MSEKNKYYMFIDECGDQNLSAFDENFPIFTLCGVLMSHSQLRAMEAKIATLKKKYWGEKTVILHSRDIRKCDKEFKILFDLDVKKRFYEDLDAILGEPNAYTAVSCSILKEPYIRQFGRFNDIYGQSLSFLIERSIFFLDDVAENADMHVMAEMRGKQQDQNLLNYYNKLRDVGTHWVTPERLQSHIRKFDFLSKKQNVTGLQLADLIAYPITQYLLYPDRVNFAYDIVKDNIYVSDDKKLGLKVIPRLEKGV
ncbi:MAG: DUF3800 domain-containing protein [Bacteroidales bacterium]|nr:DUF3800 domain-containing protein [Bacteroidales bacterium]